MEPTLYVVARYTHDRAYGGPEEGGWWYDCGELERIVTATRNGPAAWRVASILNEYRADRCKPRRLDVVYRVVELPRKDVLPEYRDYACHGDPDEEIPYVTRWDIPEYYPEGRPHYC